MEFQHSQILIKVYIQHVFVFVLWYFIYSLKKRTFLFFVPGTVLGPAKRVDKKICFSWLIWRREKMNE